VSLPTRERLEELRAIAARGWAMETFGTDELVPLLDAALVLRRAERYAVSFGRTIGGEYRATIGDRCYDAPDLITAIKAALDAVEPKP
jgi:hypothetical protein